jgi:hypothetical protein
MLDPSAVHSKSLTTGQITLNWVDRCLVTRGDTCRISSQNRLHIRADHPTKKASPGGHFGVGESGML